MRYEFPPLQLLRDYKNSSSIDIDVIEQIGKQICDVFKMWSSKIYVVTARETPLSLCFDIASENGHAIKNIQKMKDDLEVHVGSSVEFFSDNDNGLITIVVLRKERPLISFKQLINCESYITNKSPLSVVAGMNYNGETAIVDIQELPHLLIAGTTGSGKTMFLDSIIMSLLYKTHPNDVKMIMIDPKRVDLSYYNGIPHLLAPVIYENDRIFGALSWVETEMMKRYQVFSDEGVKNLSSYNEKIIENYMSHIVVFIDEYSEFMKDYRNEFESIIERISRLGRAAGIHLIISTQRPTSDVVTSSIKSNIPSRASFAVVDSRESSAIVNKGGAQKLCGAGDMLFSLGYADKMEHLQAPFISEDEIKSVVGFLSANN